MRMAESKLRRTIRRAILITEGKKKKLAKQIAAYVEEQCEQGMQHETCTKENLMQMFGPGTEGAINRLINKHPSFDEAGGPTEGPNETPHYWYEVEIDYDEDEYDDEM